MNIGTCVTNCNGDLGYVVSAIFQDAESREWFFKVIWVDPLLEFAMNNKLYPETLSVTDEMQCDIFE